LDAEVDVDGEREVGVSGEECAVDELSRREDEALFTEWVRVALFWSAMRPITYDNGRHTGVGSPSPYNKSLSSI
jgi:hypothetical protein